MKDAAVAAGLKENPSAHMKLLSPISFCFAIACLLAGCDRPTKIAAKTQPAAAKAGLLEPISFNTHIQPILSKNCYHCHGPDPGTREPKKEPLRLDQEKYAFMKREGGNPVIIKGDAAASAIIRVIHSSDPDEVMPPPKSHNQLTDEEKSLVKRWVSQGAKYEDHWSFIAPKRPAPPTVPQPERVKNPIDTFIQDRLVKKGIPLAPPENPRALIRRVTLDMIGLLPEPADVEAFLKNPTDAAYTAYLDKLFASPAYAEHRTRYWLDYSRYGDTHGLHFDNKRSIWPYRDYVIRSFAANKPYDQFVREQLAGDLIPAKNADAWIATGYLRCNVSTNEGGTIYEEVQASNTRDRTEAFGAAFLGLTVGCAACHDHKFDPTSQRDFYALGAFFNNTADSAWDGNKADHEPVLRLPTDATERGKLDAMIATASTLDTQYAKHLATAPERFQAWLKAGNSPKPVSSEALDLRLRLDEGKGEALKNSAPAAKTLQYTTDTNPPVWGADVFLWPAMRMATATNLPLPDQGDFEMNQPFSASMWATFLKKSVNKNPLDDFGSLISRMDGGKNSDLRGWDLMLQKGKLIFHLIQKWPQQAIKVEADLARISVTEWSHLGFSYDGSGKAEGVKLYFNGESLPTQIVKNTLQPDQSTRTTVPLQIGQRTGGNRLREVSLQDLRLYRRNLSPEEFSRLPYEDLAAETLAAKPDLSTWSPLEKFLVLNRYFSGSVDAEAIKLQAEIAATSGSIEKIGQKGDATLVGRERENPAIAWVLDRGLYSSRKEMVSPATPEFLPKSGNVSDRKQLAEWLFTPEQPLFSRVTVNRMWQEIFGTGLVETADDFGLMGARPANPELLDWLAVEFRESGWNVNHLYKLLLTSNAYRQSNHVSREVNEVDLGNRLLSRGPRFRMDAEMLRDTALQSAGLLAPKVGGPSVFPYQPEGLWEAVSMPESTTLHYKQDKGEGLYRRSMYSFWKRFAPPPSLETFDAQAREVVCVRRARTNTPLQALVSMNDPQFVEASRKLAERAIQHSSAPPERLGFLAETLLSRSLTPKESSGLTKSLSQYAAHFQAQPQDAKDLLTTGEVPANAALDPVEIATWAMLANQLLNLDETLTK